MQQIHSGHLVNIGPYTLETLKVICDRHNCLNTPPGEEPEPIEDYELYYEENNLSEGVLITKDEVYEIYNSQSDDLDFAYINKKPSSDYEYALSFHNEHSCLKTELVHAMSAFESKQGRFQHAGEGFILDTYDLDGEDAALKISGQFLDELEEKNYIDRVVRALNNELD